MDPRAQHEPADGPPRPETAPAAVDGASTRTLPAPDRAVLVMMAGIVLAVALGLLVGARLGTLTIAIVLAAAGTWRATSHDGPPGLVVRTRTIDVGLCWSVAAVIGFLAITAPGLG